MKGPGRRMRMPTDAELNAGPSYGDQLKAQDALKDERPPPVETRQRNDLIIAQYLKKTLGKQSLTYCVDKKNGKRACVPLYNDGRHATFNWDRCRYIDFTCTFDFRGDIAADGTLIPFKDGVITCKEPLPTTTDEVTFVSCCLKNYDNAAEKKLAATFNVMNDHKAYKDVDVDTADMQEAVGILRGAFVDFEAQTSKEEDRWALRVQSTTNTRTGQETYYHFTNPDFMTMTYGITGDPLAGPRYGKPREECCEREIEAHQNNETMGSVLWDGLIRLPSALCKEAGLFLYSNEEAEKLYLLHRKLQKTVPLFGEANDEEGAGDTFISDSERRESKYLNWPDEQRIRCYYAMDYNHVLSWPLHTAWDVRRRYKIECERLDISLADGKRVEGPWLVPDTVLRSLMQHYQKTWANRVDVRKDVFNTTGFVVAPFSKYSGDCKDVKLRFTVHCKCITWNNNASTHVAPRLHPAIPSVQHWIHLTSPKNDDDEDEASAMMNKLKV